jgi:RNA polymerase sigma-70 factor (ECF subfamily)
MQVASKFTEQELIALLRGRSRDGFNYLYENYSGAIYAVILAIVTDRDHAADILQETFVKIWKQIDTYNESKGRLYTWMVQIARNSALDLARSKKFQVSQQNQELPEAVYEKGSNDFNPDKIGVRKIVGQMKQEHRELIELSYFQGFTQDEMAEMLHLPLGTVKTRMRSALIQLRKMYKQ